MHGLNWCDFGNRHLRNDAPVWTTMDPLCEKYPWLSPYVYCGNNPMRFIDPTGREWLTAQDGEYARKLTKELQTKIGSTQKSINKLKSRIERLQAKGEDTSKLKTKIDKKNEKVTALQAGVSELDAMGKTTDQKFTYSNGDINSGETSKDKNGIIVMSIANDGALSNGIHESSHGYDLWQQGYPSTIGEKLDGEIKAYSRQFYFDSNSIPTSYFGKVYSVQDINERWIYGIQNSEGTFIYMKFVDRNMNTDNFLKFLKSQ